MAAESSYEHWGLLHRLQRVLELLDNAEAAGNAVGLDLGGVRLAHVCCWGATAQAAEGPGIAGQRRGSRWVSRLALRSSSSRVS